MGSEMCIRDRLRTVHQPGHARRRCYCIEAVVSLYWTTEVSKMSRDSVSGDVSFHRPAVELLVVTMHIRAQLRDTKSGFHRSILRVIGGNFTAIFFNASAHNVGVQPNLSIYDIFRDFAETSDRSVYFFFLLHLT